MTNWEKLKVAELKDECKQRNISLTGLKLKQQIVDKLVEYESNSQGAAPAEESVAEKANGACDEVEKVDEPAVAEDQDENQKRSAANRSDDTQKNITDATDNASPTVESTKKTGKPTILGKEDTDATALEAEADEKKDTIMADAAEEVREPEGNTTLTPEADQRDVADDAQVSVEAKEEKADTSMESADQEPEEAPKGPEPTNIVNDIEEAAQITRSTLEEDSWKRKRRSISPPLEAQEVTKKSKAENGEAVPTKTVSRSLSREPTPAKENGHVKEPPELPARNAKDKPDHGPDEKVKNQADEGEDQVASRERHRSVASAANDIVEPAIHAATRSLYMRNFKRPLNMQSLRSHMVTVAQGSSSVAPGDDPIRFFNVNNIKSHAFVTFATTSAASRVRSAMHGTRFPNEPQRDPLWIDFVPDEKVEDWVDREMSGNRGSGRNSGAKLEVVYSDTGNGMVALFQEVGSSYPLRPSISSPANNRASFSQRQPSYSADPTRTVAIASGIHPDRAGIVPTSPINRRRSPPPPQPISQNLRDQGIGFKGLDDLFSSTEAKPKLYYKLQPQAVIDDRLDLLRDLYSDRGVTGDPGMKRYTFEKEKGREEWVDDGPEFGHGKRGQDRLQGIGGRGRGGYRGRGGAGRGQLGDSYRGGGRR